MTVTGEPYRVEIVAYAPTAYFHCMHCEVVWQETGFSDEVRREQVASALPPDLLADYQAVSDWVHRLTKRFGDRVAVNVVDAASVEGVWKTLRYGLQRYPAVILPGGYRQHDFAAAEAEIGRRIMGETAAA